MKLLTILLLPLALLYNCKELPDAKQHHSVEKQVATSQIPAVTQITFGVYCGECYKNCATMYRYTTGDKSFAADYTDAFFNRDGKPIPFGTSLKDAAYVAIGDDIIAHIPKLLLDSEKDTDNFGCPDCTDGCGIYFEMVINGATKYFYIDSQTEQLTGEIKTFAGYLKLRIAEIKNKAGR